ncbi:MAG TPA: N-acetyltransferase [Armatimonadota bacterium]|jgi:ribosomal protein S18 acetylase RimI-like enzyme
MTLRRARAQDVPAISDIWQAMAELHSQMDPRFGVLSDDLDTFVRYLRSCLRSRDSCVLVAEESPGTPLLGFAIGQLRDGPRSLGHRQVGHISDLAVSTAYRRRGIGTALCQSLLHWFRECRVGQVTLNVSCANVPAQAFWERQGFRDFTHRMCLCLGPLGTAEGRS